MPIHWLPLALSLLAQQNALSVPQPDPRGNEIAQREVHVQLSIRDGKTVFRSGEPIRVVMSITADQPGYSMEFVTSIAPSPADDVTVTPDTGLFHWLDVYSMPDRYWPGVSSPRGLSARPTEIVLALNEWVRFDASGEYTVRVTTGRVSSAKTHRLRLVSNPVTFRIQMMTDAEEEAEGRRLSALLDTLPPRDLAMQERCGDLGFLTGDPGAREKVRRYLQLLYKPVPSNCVLALERGFYVSKNPQLILSSLEERMRDPAEAVSANLIAPVVALRVWTEMPGLITSVAGDMQALRRLKAARRDTITQQYFDEVARSLEKRTGDSRRWTAYGLSQLNGGQMPLPPAARRILIDEFEKFEPLGQSMLVHNRWKDIRDPSLVPAVRRLAETSNDQSAEAPLQALLDIAPKEARDLLIASILNPRSFLSFRFIRQLPDETLPEVDAPLLAQLTTLLTTRDLRNGSLLENKSALLARYATGAIRQDVLKLYHGHTDGLEAAPRAHLLAYLGKWNEPVAMPLIEEAIRSSRDADPLLSELTDLFYSAAIDALLRGRLEGDEPRIAAEAAGRLAAHGGASARPVLEARLARWLAEWRPRVAELEADVRTRWAQGLLEAALISAILGGKDWKISDTEAQALKLSCITTQCRDYFGIR